MLVHGNVPSGIYATPVPANRHYKSVENGTDEAIVVVKILWLDRLLKGCECTCGVDDGRQ
jgi:hypothetical protein